MYIPDIDSLGFINYNICRILSYCVVLFRKVRKERSDVSVDANMKTAALRVEGMTCANCQHRIERKLRAIAGVSGASASFGAGVVEVTYNAGTVALDAIIAVIDGLGYKASVSDTRMNSAARGMVILLAIPALYFLLERLGLLNKLAPSQLADSAMGYGALFLIGLITSVHCIAMCGGINLSQSLPRSDAKEAASGSSRISAFIPTILYNLGRVISYTAVGFILGLMGMLISGGTNAGVPVVLQGILKLIAGVVMVIMGINMLGIFPRLSSLRLKWFNHKGDNNNNRNKGPFIVGLLNGLMPCGPLQSMQIVALASASPFIGAVSMFLFSLGTVPLMLGFGSIVSALGAKHRRIVTTIGATLVVALGLAMLSQGGMMSGFLSPNMLAIIIIALCVVGFVSLLPFRKPSHKTISTIATSVAAIALIIVLSVTSPRVLPTPDASDAEPDGKQMIYSTLQLGIYPDITVREGVPVVWTINAPEGSINGCNYRMNIHEYGIFGYTFKQGENVIEFTPEKTGQFMYSCWMGMIRGSITVVESGTPPPV